MPASGASRVFAHISAFPAGPRPVSGIEVTYREVRDGHNRLRAVDVRRAGGSHSGRSVATGTPLAVTTAAVFFALLGGLLFVGAVPIWVVAGYVLFSVVAFGMYGADKSAAVRGAWRTSESTLHAIALLGGWPGALVARQVFRHKTTKQPFRTILWGTVVTNCAALVWFASQG